jgi:hypothetical protein
LKKISPTSGRILAPSGKRHVHAAPDRLRLNEWTLTGDWSVDKEAAVLNQANGRVAYRFHARDVNLVMGPVKPGSASTGSSKSSFSSLASRA